MSLSFANSSFPSGAQLPSCPIVLANCRGGPVGSGTDQKALPRWDCTSSSECSTEMSRRRGFATEVSMIAVSPPRHRCLGKDPATGRKFIDVDTGTVCDEIILWQPIIRDLFGANNARQRSRRTEPESRTCHD